MIEKILIGYVIWNIVVFFIYGLDKLLAKMDAYRIPEKTLMSLAIVFGAVGAWAGMRIFRHKTRHKNFVYTIPVLALVNLAALYFILQGIDK